LFSSNGALVGTFFTEGRMRSEIGLVPVPGDDCKYFIIHSRAVDALPNTQIDLFFSEYDMNLTNSQGSAGDFTPNKKNILLETKKFTHGLGIAISQINSDNQHFLYVVSNHVANPTPNNGNFDISLDINKYKITSTGIASPNLVYTEASPTFGYIPAEVDLSHDGSMLAFGTLLDDEIYIFQLDPTTGDLDESGSNPIQNIDVGGAVIKGVEFTPDGQELYFTNNNVVNYIDLVTNTQFTLPGSDFYGGSQIELASDGFMYVVRNASTIGKIDFDNHLFAANAIPGLNSSIIQNLSGTGDFGWTLPDQIDGLDYTQLDNICCRSTIIYHATNHLVNATVTWTPSQNPFNNSPVVRIEDEIRIAGNSHLTINNMTFEFAVGANIVVETGSRLTISGTTLTSTNCEEVWEGVEVWGNSAASQSTNGAQGILTIKNHSLIEHARAAVRMYSTAVACCTTNGGILFARDSEFKNNYIGVQFLSYENFNPVNNAHLANQSYIKNCDFTINDDYRFPDPMYGHIRLWAVDGIAITDCSFKSEQTSSTLDSYLHRGYAIRSSNAAYRVTSTCTVNVPQGTPCPQWNTNSFSGFYRAIWASSSNGGNPFGAYHIDRAQFENNLTGIYSNVVNNGLITRSNFDVGNWDFQDGLTQIYWGIYLNSGTGFTIEQNTMTDVGTNIFTFGIQANRTGAANNQIRNNDFTGFLSGNYATGQNRESLNSNDGLGGLRYFCNTNTQNVNDFYVHGTAVNHGVATNQGIMSNSVIDPALESAANTFSHITWDCRNFNVQEPVIFWRHSSEIAQPLQLLLKLNAFENPTAQAPNGCANAFPNGDEMAIIRLTPQELADLTNVYNNHKIETGSLESQFALNMDGGDTQATVNMITNWRDSGQTLKTALNGISPYLSQAALFATFDRSDILTNQDRFDIFVANPDELRRATTIQYAEQGANPLPQAMINSLKTAALQNFTVRSELVAKIEGRKAAMGSIADRVLLSISEDYDNFNYTFYRDWLNRKGGFETQLAIIESYINEGNLTQAVALLDDMEQNGNLNTVNQGIFDNFISIKELEMLLISENRSWAVLDTPEILQLEVIANSDFALATAQAQGILSFFYDYNFEPYFDPQSMGGQANNNSENVVNESALATGQSIYTYPTPAKEQITFQLDSPLNSNTMLTITDVNGKKVSSSLLQEGGLQFDISTASLPAGIFYYQVEINGENKSGKIVITR
jgi:Secretion system C-terminal sorting domain/Lactonase, 7-bladed beta-propeller